MPPRHRNRLTISRIMCLIAIVACAIAPFAANPGDREFVFFVFVATMVILFPVHLAIEGNRRDDLEAREARSDRTDDLPSGV